MDHNVRRELLGMKQKAKDKIRRVWVINPKTRVIPNKKKQQQKYCCRKSRNPRFKE